MVIQDNGINELATRFASDITQGQWGVSTGTATVTDTGLGNGIADTKNALSTATSSGNSSQFTHDTLSTEGNSSDLTEFGVIFDDGTTFFNRSVGGAITKTNDFDINTVVTISFIRG